MVLHAIPDVDVLHIVVMRCEVSRDLVLAQQRQHLLLELHCRSMCTYGVHWVVPSDNDEIGRGRCECGLQP